MDDSHDIADSTDWLPTPLSGLAALENALHCQICKEFFDTPMITSCCHTFCSKCIRTALSADGMCPMCRSQDQASKLRNNWQLQEVVSSFLEARPITLKLAREQQLAAENSHIRPGKRKRNVEESAQDSSQGRTTRSKSRRVEDSQPSQSDTVEIEDIEGDDAYVPDEIVDDGLVECPLGCGRRMKIEEVDPHLDKCEDERIAREKRAAIKKPPIAASRPQDRLNELNYGMMKEVQLARKLRDIGIRSSGNKQLMIRRHTAWVNMWNANCDSSQPKTKQELLKELEVWERTQGGSAPTVNSSIMKKDFDGVGWSKRNEDDFSKLIANARRTKAKAAEVKEENDSQSDTVDVPEVKGDVGLRPDRADMLETELIAEKEQDAPFQPAWGSVIDSRKTPEGGKRPDESPCPATATPMLEDGHRVDSSAFYSFEPAMAESSGEPRVSGDKISSHGVDAAEEESVRKKPIFV